ncbi:hypothetical protein, partial [Salinifilum aidingensis]
MNKLYALLDVGFTGLVLLATTTRSIHNQYGFVRGTPAIKSINALTFGPDGVLFIGDGRSAAVFAIDTKDAGLVSTPNP